MNKQLLKQLKALQLGDTVFVRWYDASAGRGGFTGKAPVDIHCKSTGVFLGVIGQKHKQLILGQNVFYYTPEEHDIDYTFVLVSWLTEIRVLEKETLSFEEAKRVRASLLRSVTGVRRRKSSKSQWRTNNCRIG